MKENISRSSIFRSKMKLEATKKRENENLNQDNKKSQFYHLNRRTNLPRENIER